MSNITNRRSMTPIPICNYFNIDPNKPRTFSEVKTLFVMYFNVHNLINEDGTVRTTPAIMNVLKMHDNEILSIDSLDLYLQRTFQLSENPMAIKRTVINFKKIRPVPLSFCNYLEINPDVELCGLSVLGRIYEKLKENNLINTEDKTIILTPELQNLFKINYNEPQPVNKLIHLVTRVYRLENIADNINNQTYNQTYNYVVKNKTTTNDKIEYLYEDDDIDLNF